MHLSGNWMISLMQLKCHVAVFPGAPRRVCTGPEAFLRPARAWQALGKMHAAGGNAPMKGVGHRRPPAGYIFVCPVDEF
jgi:hypothetical protein